MARAWKFLASPRTPDDVPDYLFSDLRSPNSPLATNAPEDFAVGELRYRQPVINGLLYPIWHWDRTDVPAFSYQVTIAQ